ncbi:MAG: hypothetical protein AAFV25_23860 [Bacteroidota bacterium]
MNHFTRLTAIGILWVFVLGAANGQDTAAFQLDPSGIHINLPIRLRLEQVYSGFVKVRCRMKSLDTGKRSRFVWIVKEEQMDECYLRVDSLKRQENASLVRFRVKKQKKWKVSFR